MDFDAAIRFYESALATGENPAAQVGWHSGEGYQLANFAVLCDLEELSDGASVLDVGCGLGALLDYFARIGKRVEYVGVDISKNMIEAARERHPDAVFEVRDILASPPSRRFDVVICSGTLNRRIPEHARWMADMIARMYELAERAVAFNVLNAANAPSLRAQLIEQDDFVRVSPEEMLRFCRRLTPDVYMSNLWSGTFEVVLRRPRANQIADLASTLQASEGAALEAVVEIAFRRRAYGELRDFLRALPQSAYVLEQLANAHARLGENTEAIAAYEQVAALVPERADACTSIGRIHFDAVRDDDALAWFRLALARDADAVDARYGLVLSLLRSGRTTEAREAALETPPGPLRDVLDARTSPGPDAAVAAYERALAAAPRLIDALIALAMIHEQRGRWVEAIALWQRAVEASGDDDRVRERLLRARGVADRAMVAT